jgi:hypothetical protein
LLIQLLIFKNLQCLLLFTQKNNFLQKSLGEH